MGTVTYRLSTVNTFFLSFPSQYTFRQFYAQRKLSTLGMKGEGGGDCENDLSQIVPYVGCGFLESDNLQKKEEDNKEKKG